MDMKGNNSTHGGAAASGITARAAVTDPLAEPLQVDGVDERMRAELEQAHVAMEDMNDRIAELARANEELTDRLQHEMRRREETEQQLLELRSEVPDRKPDDGEKDMLRHELSMVIEELQIMQEELQSAHDELGRRTQTCSTHQVSESLVK
jgi:DNA repair exonuclease SbcCD ATPase subunit